MKLIRRIGHLAIVLFGYVYARIFFKWGRKD